MAEPRAAGAIYDLGYQPYTGPRHGRGYAIRSLFAFSLRSAFGLGRGERAKTMPGLVVAVVYLVAIVQIIAASATGRVDIINYSNFLEFSAFLLALFAASQAPELIIADKQHGVLSLYFARPLTSRDYALAKLGALTAAMLVITLGPQLLLLMGRIMSSESPWPAFTREWVKVFPILGGSLLISLFVSCISLMLASFATRRGYGSAGVIVFFLLTPALVTMFRAVTSGAVKRYAILAHPVYLIVGFADWLFDIEARRRSAVGRADLAGPWFLGVMVAVCLICLAVFLRRYRSADA